ncbi:MAG: HipA domain-containing protein [Defluviitaleaceae bacterium]|nr:HipA domain-containing protein [Defluviitaleaceae bacterium]
MSRKNIEEWTLMHKNIPVADIELIKRNATITGITKTYHISHAPLGITEDNEISEARLENWLSRRAIPASRENIDEVLENLRIQNTRKLSLRSYGLSLSDQYWLKPYGSNITWDRVNFFQNKFSKDLGEMISGERKIPSEELPDVIFYTPDSSADGWLKKKWIIKDSKRILMKGASPLYKQEPFNEKIASDIMKHLGINHVTYDLTKNQGEYFSLCETFIDENTELVPALNIVMHEPQEKDDTRLSHLLRGCVNLNMDPKHIKLQLDKMMVVDYLIGNYDRHWKNFGFIRDVNTLEFKDFSPIFDNGASFWQHHPHVISNVATQTFKEHKTLDKQLELVTDLSWYHPIPEETLHNMIKSTLDQHPTMLEDRKDAIINMVIKHGDDINRLKDRLHF